MHLEEVLWAAHSRAAGRRWIGHRWDGNRQERIAAGSGTGVRTVR